MILYRMPNGTMIGPGPKAAGGCPVRVPCGTCVGCMLERSQGWALRCRHEASIWDHNVFLTLTYDDDHLPWHGSLNREHVSKFVRSLRKRMDGVQCAPGSESRPIRFFACGEYGSRTKRAHYHLLLFNVYFEDRIKHGSDTYLSPIVSDAWSYGSHLIGTLTPASAAYVAGYATKKVAGRLERDAAYEVVNPSTGEVFNRIPEFNLMSNRPGIGQYWYDRFKTDIRKGFLRLDGKQVPVPRFYEEKFVADFPELVEEREYMRTVARMARDPNELSEDRLVVKKLVAVAKKRLFEKSHSIEG
jgi:hypothetical protein